MRFTVARGRSQGQAGLFLLSGWHRPYGPLKSILRPAQPATLCCSRTALFQGPGGRSPHPRRPSLVPWQGHQAGWGQGPGCPTATGGQSRTHTAHLSDRDGTAGSTAALPPPPSGGHCGPSGSRVLGPLGGRSCETCTHVAVNALLHPVAQHQHVEGLVQDAHHHGLGLQGAALLQGQRAPAWCPPGGLAGAPSGAGGHSP